ncbi:MAG: family 20 glycosylhydrolase [Cellvibrionaceae bacterium]
MQQFSEHHILARTNSKKKLFRSKRFLPTPLVTALLSSLALSLGGCHSDPSTASNSSLSSNSSDTDTSSQIDAQTRNAIKSQAELVDFAEKLELHYQVIDNRPTEDCDQKIADGLCFQARLSLSLPENFLADNWALYFSHMSPIQWADKSHFTIEHLNGDLHRLSPNKEYRGFKKDQKIPINLRATYWHLSKSDVMPNYYLTSGELTAVTVTSTMAQIDTATGLEKLPHAGNFSEVESQLKRSVEDASVVATSSVIFDQSPEQVLEPQQLKAELIPTPKSIKHHDGSISLESGYRLTGKVPVKSEIQAAIDGLSTFGIVESTNGIPIIFDELSAEDASDISPSESYRLIINDDAIKIFSNHSNGAYYALRSLESLLFSNEILLPLVEIMDQPRFAFRGMHLDVARNFRDKHYVIALLEQMSRYKLNRLHLHLGDDEGWRVEIDDLPELTRVGSKRCHDPSETECLMPQLGSGPNQNSSANGYYTKRDYQDILLAAQARHIEVIPSFDMPGHSRAAVVSMESRYQRLMAKEETIEAERYRLIDPLDKTRYQSIQFYNDNTLNVCLDSSYQFVDKVISEVIALHEQVQVPLTRYHIGADETAGAWIQSPACQSLLNNPDLNLKDHHDLTGYFVERVAKLVSEKGIVPAGWNDGMSTTDQNNMPSAVQSNAWTPLFWDGHAKAHEQANRNWQVVLSIPDVTYFDFPYAVDAQERGYYWASRNTNSQQAFEFMPDNLPAHAEIWTDRQNLPMTLDDRQTHLHKGVSFYGLQGHLWTETTRSDSQADYMIFPRLIALAERAWHKADWEVDYNYRGQLYSPSTNIMSVEQKQQRNEDWVRFSNLLTQKEFGKLDHYGVDYRIPTVGGRVDKGILTIRSPLPGLPLQYRIDQQPWTNYQKPLSLDTHKLESLSVRALSADRQRAGRSLELF